MVTLPAAPLLRLGEGSSGRTRRPKRGNGGSSRSRSPPRWAPWSSPVLRQCYLKEEESVSLTVPLVSWRIIVGFRHSGVEENAKQVLFGGSGWESWRRTNGPCQTHTVSTFHRHTGTRPLRRESRFLGGWILQLPSWLTEREIKNARLLISPSWQTEGPSFKCAPWQAALLQQCHGRTGQTFPSLGGNSLRCTWSS